VSPLQALACGDQEKPWLASALPADSSDQPQLMPKRERPAAQFRGARAANRRKADIARGYVRRNMQRWMFCKAQLQAQRRSFLHNVSFRKSLHQFSRQKASILL
jgi:hypothetical protein